MHLGPLDAAARAIVALLIAVASTVIISPAFALAAASTCTQVGGTIAANTTWTTATSPYCVTSNVDVVAGVTLTVQPGVIVKVSRANGIQIDGTLIAQGSPTSGIRFTSAAARPAPGDWNYLYFSPSSHGSILQYTTVEYAGGAAASFSLPAGAIEADSAAPILDHDVIQKNKLDGVDLFDFTAPASPQVTNSQILANGVGTTSATGLNVLNGSSTPVTSLIQDNVVSGTLGVGIFYYSDTAGSSGTIANNTVSNNLGTGINVAMGSANSISSNTLTLSGNTVSDNGAGIVASGDGAESTCSYTISDNTILNNLGAGIDALAYNTSLAAITTNTVSGNGGGGIIGYEYQTNWTTVALTITSNVVTGNSTSGNGGGIRVSGDGLYFNYVTLSGNTVSGNVATGQGGGIAIAPSTSIIDPTMTNNTVSGNTASDGGGVAIDFVTLAGTDYPSVSGNVISSNTATATNGGGGVYFGPSNFEIGYLGTTNNAISGNTAGSGASANPNDVTNENTVGTNINATSNWWGTTDLDTIASHIWDNADDPGLGIVYDTPILTATIPLPDLILAALNIGTAPVTPGASFGVQFTVSNTGTGSASASSVGFYLSTTPTKGASAIKLTGTPTVPMIGSSSFSTTSTTVIVPRSTPSGSYYLIGCANDSDLVSESNGQNDCAAALRRVHVS
jgi:parallel beta-helix repeat protein